MIKLIALLSAVALVGCASQDYGMYSDAQIKIATANAKAEEAKYNALAQIAASGSDTAKVAAVMSLQFQSIASNQRTQLIAPKSNGETALQWASILVPTLTQVYAIGKQADVQIESSRNSASVAKSTNETMLGIAQRIQSNVTTTTTTDSTHALMVVVADPVIVNQPAPVVVDPSYPPAAQ